MKQFDNIFREKVKEAFGSYNADHLADKGWNSLISRKNDRRWLLLMLPLWAKAASVAIIIGLGSFFAYHISNRQTSEEQISVEASNISKEAKPQPGEKTGTIPPIVALAPETGSPGGRTQSPAFVIRENPFLREPIPAGTDTIPGKTAIVELQIQLPVVAEERTRSHADSLNNLADIAAKILQEGPAPESGESEMEKPSGKTSLMAGFSGLLARADEAESTSHGIALGFYIDQKITERISVRPGLVMSRNSFGIENRNGVAESGYTVPTNDGTTGRIDSYNGHFDMIAMELPLNFVFKISGTQRSGLYVSAGASTMIYLSQKFTGNFVNEYTKKSYVAALNAFASETRYSSVEVENSYGAFRRADFFRLINFSAAYSLPYGKSGVFIIEPFLQLPVDDLTSLDLRVRYGGVSMKVRFGKAEAQ